MSAYSLLLAAWTVALGSLSVLVYRKAKANQHRAQHNLEIARQNARMADANLAVALDWRKATDLSALDACRIFPVRVLVAAWYDGQYSSTFTCEAEYTPGTGFGRVGGGSLGNCVVTHYRLRPPPPPEEEMLAVALAGVRLHGRPRLHVIADRRR